MGRSKNKEGIGNALKEAQTEIEQKETAGDTGEEKPPWQKLHENAQRYEENKSVRSFPPAKADAVALGASGKMSYLFELSDKLDAGRPYDLNRKIAEFMRHMKDVDIAHIEAGKCLILIKEYEGHGNFMKWLSSVDVEASQARRWMRIAKLCIENPDFAKEYGEVGPTRQRLISGLSDEQLKEFIPLNPGSDVKRKTTRELEQQIKKLKAETRKKATSNERLNWENINLKRRLRHLQPMEEDAIMESHRLALTRINEILAECMLPVDEIKKLHPATRASLTSLFDQNIQLAVAYSQETVNACSPAELEDTLKSPLLRQIYIPQDPAVNIRPQAPDLEVIETQAQ